MGDESSTRPSNVNQDELILAQQRQIEKEVSSICTKGYVICFLLNP